MPIVRRANPETSSANMQQKNDDVENKPLHTLPRPPEGHLALHFIRKCYSIVKIKITIKEYY